MGEQPILSGLGKLFFCRVEDMEKNPGIPVQSLGETIMLKPGMLTYKDDEKTYSPKWYSITGNALLKEPCRELIEKLWEPMPLVDVKINREPGRMPRKMKKAHRSDYRRNTKWVRKVNNYLRRLSLTLHNAEMVITKEQRDILSATLSVELKKS